MASISGCARVEREVIVYSALDQVFSSALLAEFERQSGIRVRAVYDTEATKTTGLAERLRRERARPRCDVFWSNEILRTIRLAREDVFDPYLSPAASAIPARFRDPAGLWTGFAARARALAFDAAATPQGDVPRSHAALADPRWRGQIAMGNFDFGTTGSHLALLHAAWGEAGLRDFLAALRRNDVQIAGGNATSRDRVLDGSARLGLTDTDDIEVVRRQGTMLGRALFEDDGVVLIPNTVALVRGAPHPAEARALIDFLLSVRTEAQLAESPSGQIPLRDTVPVPAGGLRLADLRVLEVDYDAAATELIPALEAAREILR
ncbi:MAG: ABC transporter substrate-binding protein [Planctomycetes bacterium]|nr:ABC transporter substrate-binding protein [Planctomycetota bacterium]